MAMQDVSMGPQMGGRGGISPKVMLLAGLVAGAALLVAVTPVGAGSCTSTGVTAAQLSDWSYAAPPFV